MAELFLDGTKLTYHLPTVNQWLKEGDIFPIHVEISPAGGCNQRCIHCCVGWAGHKPQLLSRKLLLNLADSFAKAGVKSFLLAGEGEPLLNKYCAEMAARAHRLGIDVALNSNAVLLSEGLSSRLLPHLVWARFSIQAADPKKYGFIHGCAEADFKKAVTNIARAVEFKRKNKLKVTLGIQQILIPQNVDQIYKVAKLSKGLGVDYFVVKRFSKHPKNSYNVPVDIVSRCAKIFKQTAALSDKRFDSIVRWHNFQDDGRPEYKQCLGLPFITQVLSDGGIYTCCNFFRDKRFCYGNLYEKSFAEIWLSRRRRQINGFVKNKVHPAKCMSFCRHHSVNKFLWEIKHIPKHVNFI